MRTLTRILLASSGAALAVLSTTPVAAQVDIHPQLPNVLLLIDNSGSMEYLIEPAGKLPGDALAPNTACDGTTSRAAINRWATLVTVLTGSIASTDFSCKALDRHSAAFTSEFSDQGAVPYDKNYYLPFNRIYSNGCTYGAGTLPNPWNWWNLPSAAPGSYVDSRWVNAAGSVVPVCNFKQAGDGLLDAFKGLVRFGMMTLDTLPDPGTGSTGGAASPTADYTTGNKGMWSYFHNWVAGAGTTPSINPGPLTPVGGPGTGNPAGCGVAGAPTPRFFEVGARNQSAPPWEGRLVPFGDPTKDVNVASTNDQIQLELLSSRPYGATPIAALLDDANEFLFHDQTSVPVQAPTLPHYFGPSDDKYWINGCRNTFVILMSDGLDNMDLRAKNVIHTFPTQGACTTATCPAPNVCASNVCTAAAYNGCDTVAVPPKGGGTAIAGNCPYLPADQIASSLRTTPPQNQSVLTYVVGFTGSDMTKFTPVPTVPSGATNCNQLKLTDCVFPPLPALQPSPQLLACCALQKIAIAGGTTQAYFADNTVTLKTALSGILSQISSGTTDRTSPVYAPAGNRAAQGMAFGAGLSTAAYQFAASFRPTSSAPAAAGVGAITGGPWTGSLVRERFSCGAGSSAATPQAIHPELGDDYALNLDYADSMNPRLFFTAIGQDVGKGKKSEIDSDYSMRPFIGTLDDNFGTYTTDTSAPNTPQLYSTFPGSMATYPAAFGIPSDALCTSAFNTTNQTTCTSDLVNWEIGGDNPIPAPTFQTRHWSTCPSACPGGPTGCTCRQLGAIFHSTPTVVGPPREFLRDDSYATYANTPAVSSQETMLYTATMDGQLHAFKVQAGNTSPDNFFTDHKANNERWSFFPPRVLQHLLTTFNSGGVPLLDGVPVIADVPGTVYDLSSSTTAVPLLERTGVNVVGWHRVLLSSGGGGGGFYYALEITNPEKPYFLWQMSTDAGGTPLFGSATPTPAIAIVNVSLSPGAAPTQLPIAILPGGTGTLLPSVTSCTTTAPIPGFGSNIAVTDGNNLHLLTGVNNSPPPLRCWDMSTNNSRASGNSLTIVRLDTGRVLAHLIGQNYSGGPHSGGDKGGDNGKGGDDNKKKKMNNPGNVFDAPFLAPLTGVPVAYPGQTGQISDRVYIGDADGLLWRVDMSDPDITHWGAKITLAWDAYLNDTSDQREGIGVPPIISRDGIGNPVILLATGDQDMFSTQPSANHVWSLSELPTGGNTSVHVSPNWHLRMPGGGARVTGPMALFNSALYFATFLPQKTNPCSDGIGSVWGVDYLRRGGAVGAAPTPAQMMPLVSDWPSPAFPPGTPGANIYGLDGAVNTIIMGIGLSETPTCDSSSTSPDPYFGSHTAVTGASGSNYQVSWQTGAGPGVSNSNTAVKNDANVKGMQYIQPPPPGRGTRIDSWASIVE